MLGNEDNMKPQKPDVMVGYMLNKSFFNNPPREDIVGPEFEFTRKTSETMLGIIAPQLGSK
jgi:hypothetical protein